MQKKVMTKKGHQIFGQEKCTPRENPGYAYGRVRRTAKLSGAVERSRVSSQRSHSSARYCGVIPCWMSNIKVQSLNCIRLDTGSQCSRFRRGDACDRGDASQRSLARAVARNLWLGVLERPLGMLDRQPCTGAYTQEGLIGVPEHPSAEV